MSDASLPSAPDHTGIELTTTLSLSSGEQRWGSERRMALLAAIDTEGSISAAARKVGLSYKAAWDAVDMMNSLAGGLLVERITGGKRGGGALLTTRARELVAWYQAVQAEHRRFMDVLSRFGPDGARNLDLLHSMALQTSARNRFEGIIRRIESGRVNDRLHLQLDEQVTLTATLTHASTERLALAPGRRALAFIKAQAIHIRPIGAADHPDGTENSSAGELPADMACWSGRVSHRTDGDGLGEISLDITPHIRITGLTAARDFADPGLDMGSTAQACFQSRDVLIGTLD
ncbi:TOBE domain-containing protein [Castellaniella sp. MT123]|uniref:TOBE domain-containing protein n=1 Tax=Castellaniella sp. MT123 TaxID=3140381 RepID=UPI0031F3D7D1